MRRAFIIEVELDIEDENYTTGDMAFALDYWFAKAKGWDDVRDLQGKAGVRVFEVM